MRRVFLYILLVSVFLVLNYNPQSFVNPDSPTGWIFSLCASPLLILILIKADPLEWKSLTGLAVNGIAIRTAAFWFLLLLAGTAVLLFFVSSANGYTYSPSFLTYINEIRKGNTSLSLLSLLPLYLYHIPQTFNEEMISGAFLLKKVKKLLPHLSDTAIAFIVSLIFGIAHFFFYLVTPAQSGMLEIAAVLTLILAGWIRNTLILSTGHILYAWVFHLAWNLLFFPSYYFIKFTRFVLEGETKRINLVLGDWRTLLVGIVCSVAIGIWFLKKGNVKRRYS